MYKLIKKVPAGLEQFTAKVLNGKLKTILSSPIGSGTAREVVEEVVETLNADQGLKEILDIVGKGGFTVKELSDVILTKASNNIEHLRKTVENVVTGSDEATNIMDAVNKMVKENFGYDTLAEYVADMETLLPHANVRGQKAIKKLKDFLAEILRQDARNSQLARVRKYSAQLDTLKEIANDVVEKPIKGTTFDKSLQNIKAMRKDVKKFKSNDLLKGLDKALSDGVTAAEYKQLFEAAFKSNKAFQKALWTELSFVLELHKHFADVVRKLNPLKQMLRLAPNTMLSGTVDLLKNVRAYCDILKLFNTYVVSPKGLIKKALEFSLAETDTYIYSLKDPVMVKYIIDELFSLERSAPTAQLKQFYRNALHNLPERYKTELPKEFLEDLTKYMQQASREAQNIRPKAFIDTNVTADALFTAIIDNYNRVFKTKIDSAVDKTTATILENMLQQTNEVFNIIRNNPKANIYKAFSKAKLTDSLAEAVTHTINNINVANVRDFNFKKLATEITRASHIANIIRDILQRTDSEVIKEDINTLSTIAKDKTKQTAVQNFIEFLEKRIKETPDINAGNSADTFMADKLEHAIDTLKKVLSNPDKVEYEEFKTAYDTCADTLHKWQIDMMPTAPAPLKRITSSELKTFADVKLKGGRIWRVDAANLSLKKTLEKDPTLVEIFDGFKTLAEGKAVKLDSYFWDQWDYALHVAKGRGVSNSIIKTLSQMSRKSTTKFGDVVLTRDTLQLTDTIKQSIDHAISAAQFSKTPKVIQEFYAGKAVDITDFVKAWDAEVSATMKGLTDEYTQAMARFDQESAELFDTLQMFEPFHHVSEKLKMVADALFYKFKGEQVFNTAIYLSNQELANQILDLANQGSNIGRYLHTLTKSDDRTTAELAQRLINLSDNFAVYRNTYSRLNDLVSTKVLDEQELTAVQSTIQKYARKSIYDIDIDAEDSIWFKEFLKECSNFYNNAYKYNKAYAQDAIIARNKAYAKQFGIAEYYHSAAADAYCTLAIAKTEKAIQEYLQREGLSGRKLKAIDIETTGLNKVHKDDINEFGIADDLDQQYSKGVGHRFVMQHKTKLEALAKMPSRSALAKLFPDEATYTARVKAYLKEYVNEHAKSKTQVCNDFLTELFKDGDDVVILTHNGSDFDIDMMKEQFRMLGVNPELLQKFEKATFIDNLEVLRQADGYISLRASVNKQQAIKEILQDHIKSLSKGTGYDYFFDLGINSIKQEACRLLDEVVGPAKNFNHKPRFTPKVKGISEKNPVEESLTDLLKEIAQTGVSVKKLADGLPLVSLNTVRDELPELLLDALKNSEIFKDVKFEPGTEAHLTRLLYGWVTGINPYGYLPTIDTNVIMDWFNVSVDEVYDVETLMLYTEHGRKLTKYRDRLKNYVASLDKDTIIRYRQFLREAQEKVEIDPTTKKSLKKVAIEVEWLKALRTDNLDSASVVTAVSKIVQSERTKLPDKLIRKYSDVLRGVKKDYVIDTTKFASAVEYDEAIGLLKNQDTIDDALEEMELSLGAHRIVSSTQHYQNSALRKTLHYIESYKKLLEESTQEVQVEMIQQQREAFEKLCETQTLRIASLNPEEMLNHMLSNRNPIMWFGTDTVQLNMAGIKLLENAQAYEAVGVSVKKVGDEIFLYFNKNHHFDHYTDREGFHATFDGVARAIDFSQHAKLNLNDALHDTGALGKVLDDLATITNGQSIGHLGNRLTKEQVESYLSHIPEEIRNDINIAEYTKSTMFNGNGHLFDGMNLGSVASRKKYNPYLPTDYLKLLANNAADIISSSNKKNLALAYVLNGDTSLGQLITRFGSDAVRNRLLVSEDYSILKLAQSEKLADKKIGFRGLGIKVIELNPKTNWNEIMFDSENCIIVPKYMFTEIHELLNSSKLYDSSVYKALHSVTYVTKLGQIAGSVGKIFRDVATEAVLKNMLETEDALGVAKNTFKAFGDLHNYKKSVRNILKLSEIDYDKLTAVGVDVPEFASAYLRNQREAFALVQNYYGSIKDIMKMDSHKLFLESNKELYFSQICKTMDVDTFNTMHTLITESGTLGKLPAWSKYTADLHQEKQRKFLEDVNKGLIGDMMLDKTKNFTTTVYDSLVNFGNLLLSPAQYFDQINRVAEYLTFMDSGFVNPAAAIGKITRTHFDASIKTEFDMLVELVIPFYSFFKNNRFYWAEAVVKHPHLARIYGDFVQEHYDEDTIPNVSAFEKTNNESLFNTIMSGNIILNIPTKRISKEQEGEAWTKDAYDQDAVTLKLNVPWMEAYQMVASPIGYLTNATSPVMQLALQSWFGENPAVSKAVTNFLDVYRPYNVVEDFNAPFFATGFNNLVDSSWMDKATIVPFVGPTLQKFGPEGYAYKQYEKTGFLGNAILPSVFGVLNRFPQYPELSAATKTITNSVQRKGLSSKQYQFLTQRGFNKTGGKSMGGSSGIRKKFKGYNKQVYAKKARYYTKKSARTMYYPPRRKPNDITVYNRLFNSYGKTRIQRIGLPRTVQQSKYTIKNYFDYMR